MPHIHSNTVALEHCVHLSDNGSTASFNPINLHHLPYVICQYTMRIQDILVIVHSPQIDALRKHDIHILHLFRLSIAGFVLGVSAST